MFVDRGREPDGARLRFFRWLAERGRLEHSPAGPPAGAYASVSFAEAPTSVGWSTRSWAPQSPAR
jgi:hypothetical protein